MLSVQCDVSCGRLEIYSYNQCSFGKFRVFRGFEVSKRCLVTDPSDRPQTTITGSGGSSTIVLLLILNCMVQDVWFCRRQIQTIETDYF